MSFILDALRKSEHERQRQSGPNIAELPSHRPAQDRSVLLVAVISLVVLNLAVLAFFLLRNTEAPVIEGPVTTVTAPVADVVAAPVTAVTAPVADVVATPVALTPAAAAPETEPEPTVAFNPPAPAAPDSALLPRAGISGMTESQRIPSVHSLPPQVTAGLPALSMDLHIYSDDPARRAVFINGRRYLAGGSLPEGPTVESITPDGAVLSHRGQRFLLPRQ